MTALVNISDRIAVTSTPMTLIAADGCSLSAHCWQIDKLRKSDYLGVVVINPATGVRADYYHRYAHFLAENGFVILTYDYRGIGTSKQGNLQRGKKISTREWGQFDCEAALLWAHQAYSQLPLYVVAHSIGGMLVGFSPSNYLITRCITVGAQFGYWPDYASKQRFAMWFRWHVVMPLLTAICGYCPAKAMRWHEDLPAAAAYEWAFRRAYLTSTWGAKRMPLENFNRLIGDILAIRIEDDPFGTPAAIDRLLTHFKYSRHHRITISPKSVDADAIGHFGFFHDRFRSTLWAKSLRWLSPDLPHTDCSR